MTSLLLALLSLTPAASAQDDNSVYLGDMGISATLPKGWSIPRWSDYDLEAVDAAKSTKIHLLGTSFQVVPDAAGAKVWAEAAIKRLEEDGHAGGEIVRVEVITGGDGAAKGAPVADIELKYKYKGEQPATYYQRTFAIDGRMAHMTSTGVGYNAAKAKAGLAEWMGIIKVEKPATALTFGTSLETQSGFASALPEGWREPLKSELGETRKLAAKTGQGKIDPENCWVGIRPHATGESDLLLSCQAAVWLGKVDAYSFEGIDAQVHDRFFKGAPVEIPSASPFEHADRLSLLYAFPETAETAVRMAVTPYDGGVVLTYATGVAGSGASLDESLRAALSKTTFSGADGGHHPVGVGAWISYAAAYRPLLLVVAAIPVLIFFGLLIVMSRKSKPNYDDL